MTDKDKKILQKLYELEQDIQEIKEQNELKNRCLKKMAALYSQYEETINEAN